MRGLRAFLVVAVPLALVGCKKKVAPSSLAEMDGAAPSGSGAVAGPPDPGGVLPYPLPALDVRGSAIPAGLTPTDTFATVLRCSDNVFVRALEGRAVVVRWADVGAETASTFRLARWDEATGSFEEIEGPQLKLRGSVIDLELGGTWSAPRLFVMDGNTGFREDRGHRLSLDDKRVYQFAIRANGAWRTGQGEQPEPQPKVEEPLDKLDEDFKPDEAKLKAAVAKALAASKGCLVREGAAIFANGWKVGSAAGGKCKKPVVYIVHERRDGKIESMTLPTTNDGAGVPRAEVTIVDHAWHVFVTKPDLKDNALRIDKLLRYNGTKMVEVPLPADKLLSSHWTHQKHLCVAGAKNMWCQDGATWVPSGPANCELSTDQSDFQSGLCRRGNTLVAVVGSGKSEFRELTLPNSNVCGPVKDRAANTLVCPVGPLGDNAALVFLPTPLQEIDVPLPPPGQDHSVDFVGDVAWAARNREDGFGMIGLGDQQAAHTVSRLGKPIAKPWSCAPDGTKLAQ